MTAEKFEDFESGNKPEEGKKSEEPAKEETAKTEEAKADEKSESGNDDARSWQSKADTESARANKAEAELARLKEQALKQQPGETQSKPDGAEDPWVAASKGNFRDDLYKSDPRLERLGFSPELIQGTTPGEMKQSFESLQTTVDKMTTGIRNQVLQEHGLDPAPGSGQRASGVNYRTMPTDEFNKLVDDAMRQ